MHFFNILLTLSVALSRVQAHVAHPRGHTICHEDNQLRALERFSNYADEFCPAYLAGNDVDHPEWLQKWNKWRVSSACSCYEKTATSLGPSSTALLSESALSSAPPALTSVFVSVTASPTSKAPMTASSGFGGYLPSGSIYGSGARLPSATAAFYTIPVPPSPTIAVPNTSAIDMYSSTASLVSEAATTASLQPAPTDNGNKYPPQPPGAGPGKRGLAYNDKTLASWSSLFNGSQLVTYGSNGDVIRGDKLDASLSYVPTISVDKNLNNDNWNGTIPILTEGSTKAIFGSNEPDNANKANLTVAQAVTVHKKYLQPYYGYVQLGTPAVTNSGGLAYLEEFVKACTDCSFNFVNVHFFLDRSHMTTTQYAQAVKAYIEKDVPAVQAKYPSIAGLPIFIGEVRPPSPNLLPSIHPQSRPLTSSSSGGFRVPPNPKAAI